MNKSILHTLQLLNDDITRNYSQYNESTLVKAIAEFQKKVLSSRNTDVEIITMLKKLTMKQILEICTKLNISLLSTQTNKATLVKLITGLIQQTKKKEAFLKLIQPIIIAKPKPKPKKPGKGKISISPSDYEKYRKQWLTSANPDQLTSQLDSINMNELRRIVSPWKGKMKPKGKTKKDLINAIIEYIKRMKRLTKLGT